MPKITDRYASRTIPQRIRLFIIEVYHSWIGLNLGYYRLRKQKEKLVNAYLAILQAAQELKDLDKLATMPIVFELELQAKIIYLTLQDLNDAAVTKPVGRFDLEFILNMHKQNGQPKLHFKDPDWPDYYPIIRHPNMTLNPDNDDVR